MNDYEIVYISRACNKDLYRKLTNKTNIAANKFNYTISKELSKKFIVHSLYIFDSTFNKDEKILEGNYIQYLTNKCSIIKRLPYIFKKSYKILSKKNSLLIADALNYSDSFISCLIAKVFKRKSVAIITDLPEYIGEYIEEKDRTFKQKMVLKIKYFIFNMFDSYVLLTEAMKDKINTKDNYIVIEGVGNTEQFKNIQIEKKKQILYAGTLHRKYGVKNLIEAFEEYCKKHNDEICLKIYGDGDYKEEIELKSRNNKRIKYGGIADNQLILQEEINSLVLINPRPKSDESEESCYEKYSFPSKNLEYMSSGTPLMAVKLSGMPDEYLPYIYEIKDSSVDGIIRELEFVLSKSENEINKKGEDAKNFIINNKVASIQVEKIINELF